MMALNRQFTATMVGFLAATASVAALAQAANDSSGAAGPVISRSDVPIEPGMARDTILSGLEYPWSMAWLPDGRMLITEKPGRLLLLEKGATTPTRITGAPDVLQLGQGGLLDVVVSPTFATDQTIFFTYAAGTAQANWTAVGRARFDGTALSDVSEIFRTAQAKPGGQHFGARIAFEDNDTLLVSIGDGGNPPTMLDGRFIRENAQSLASHFGKIIRINSDGTVPADNPFRTTPGALPEIWSYGHRNIQGLAIDAKTGLIWANEHGSLGGDELNQPRRGANFGWPAASLTREYVSGAPVGSQTGLAGTVDPLLVWDRSTAPSGLAVYRHGALPALEGALLSGSLMSQDVRVLRFGANGRLDRETALRVGQRVRDVRVGPDGLIYVLTDEVSGRLIRFRPSAAAPTAPAR